MSTPAIVYLCLSVVGLMVSAYEHGKPKTGDHSVWPTIIAFAITMSLLLWGGFFAQVRP